MDDQCASYAVALHRWSIYAHLIVLCQLCHKSGKKQCIYVEHDSLVFGTDVAFSNIVSLWCRSHGNSLCCGQHVMALCVALVCEAFNRHSLSSCSARCASLCSHCSRSYGSRVGNVATLGWQHLPQSFAKDGWCCYCIHPTPSFARC